VVYAERMRENLERTGGLFFSEAVMLQLINRGIARQQAYEMVQKSAMRAYVGEGRFQQLLSDDAEIGQHLTQSEIARCFDLDHALRYAKVIVQRALDAP
jgi:adenylosuccinate lyase